MSDGSHLFLDLLVIVIFAILKIAFFIGIAILAFFGSFIPIPVVFAW
jgi:hypothetical protein